MIVQKKLHFILYLMVSCSVGFDLYATTISEVFTIFSRFIHNAQQVGEVAPISSAAGQELAKYIRQNVGGKKYLEAGGGCGAVSIQLADALHKDDHLDVVEIDPEMCKTLKIRLQKYPNVSVYCCSILDWHPEYLYDGIISTLPFNSLGIDFTQRAISYFKKVSGSNCVFSYVEYPIVGQVFQHFYMGDRKRNFQAVQAFMEPIRKLCMIDQNIVYFNVPPVAIYHLCFN